VIIVSETFDDKRKCWHGINQVSAFVHSVVSNRKNWQKKKLREWKVDIILIKFIGYLTLKNYNW